MPYNMLKKALVEASTVKVQIASKMLVVILKEYGKAKNVRK
jgi:hypothetical protein